MLRTHPRRALALMVIPLMLTQGACGLVFQGFTQQVTVKTIPDGATALFSGEEVITPASVVVRRRRGWRIVRASKPGYRSACQLVPCDMNAALVTLDCFPAAVPFLLDLALGTLRRCPQEVSLNLEPADPGSTDVVLPSDSAILDAMGEGRANLCELAPAAKIIVTNGPISQSYEILGPVQIDESDFREYRLEQSSENLDSLLRLKALKLFGAQVDAIINVADHYSGPTLGYSVWRGFREHPGTAFARGLAVRFTKAGGAPPAQPAGSSRVERLRELQKLLDLGLISQDEFERKRAEILNEL